MTQPPEPIADTRRRRWGVLLSLLLVAMVLSLVGGHRGHQLSVFDEATHADYAFQVAHGNVPHRASIIAPEIRREWSCRGAAGGTVVPPCAGAPEPAATYPARGEDYNFGHPPLYYAITGFGARAMSAVIPGMHFIAAGRALGALWLFAAMAVLYLALRRFAVESRYAAAAAVTVALCPGVLHASSTITNDAPAALCGAVALLLLARTLLQGRSGWLLPLVATAAMTATKALNALPMLAVGAVLLVLALLDARRRGDPDDEAAPPRIAVRAALVQAAAIVAGFAVVYLGWQAFQSGRGPADWVSPIQDVSAVKAVGLPFDELFSAMFSGFQLTAGYYLTPQIDGETVTIWTRLLSVLVAAGPFLAMATTRRRTPWWVIGLISLVAIASYPFLVEAQVYVQSGRYLPGVTTRYGMSMIPWALACVALAAQRRRALRLTVATISAGLVVMALAVCFGWAS